MWPHPMEIKTLKIQKTKDRKVEVRLKALSKKVRQQQREILKRSDWAIRITWNTMKKKIN